MSEKYIKKLQTRDEKFNLNLIVTNRKRVQNFGTETKHHNRNAGCVRIGDEDQSAKCKKTLASGSFFSWCPRNH